MRSMLFLVIAITLFLIVGCSDERILTNDTPIDDVSINNTTIIENITIENNEHNITGELSDKFLEFYNKSKEIYDFDHPYTACILQKTCNGSFIMYMTLDPDENISYVNKILSMYGNITRIQKKYLTFKTSNIYLVNNFINEISIEDISLKIESDYQLNISDDELKYCDNNKECMSIPIGCCDCGGGGARTIINVKYFDEWNANHKQACPHFGCPAVISQAISCRSGPICQNHRCTLVNTTTPPFYMQIFWELDEKEWANVIIYLKNRTDRDKAFFNITEDELHISRISIYNNTITARVTKEGFYKLIASEYIDSIAWYKAPVAYLG